MPPPSKPPAGKQAVLDAGEPEPARRRPSGAAAPKRFVADVTAVLVAHDGAAWLPEVITRLAESTYVPKRVVCVDTGSEDGSAELLEQRFGEVLRLPRDTGYGAAVAAGLAHLDAQGERNAWVWLLHDDVAVEPTTLQALVEQAELSPSAALLGPKVRDWDDPRVLVEVGMSTDAAGHRETGLERREYDQGQHDQVKDVLAVGTAAALVLREVWDSVGGLDPHLPVFRDDLDLGWKVNAAGHRVLLVPDARVRHVRAATTGRRRVDAARGRATGVDRKHALYVLLVHASTVRLLGLVPRLVLATVLRSLGLLLTRQVAAAADEWRALLGVLGHPGAIREGRAVRGSVRRVPPRQLGPLFASRRVRLRARAAAVADWIGGSGTPMSSPLGALGDPGPDGDVDELDASGPSTLRRLIARPGVQLFVALSVLALLAERSLLFGKGPLLGGALLRLPRGASDLWASYASPWHDVTVGTAAASAPGTGALAVLSTLTLGRPSLAVAVLLLGLVPLSGLTAYLAACRLVRHQYLRLWAAATWALLPVATGTVATGRLDAAAVHVALPLLVLWAALVLTVDPRTGGWWRAWALGLALGVTSAFAPLLWPLTAVVLLAGAAVNVVLTGGRRRALAALLVAVVPAAVLFPWSLHALAHPSAFLAGPQVADPDLAAWHLALLSPGGPGTTTVLVTLGLVAAGVLGTVREAFRSLALVCWGVALLCLGAAALLSRVTVDGQQAWPGIAVQLASLAVLIAALVAANGARTQLVSTSFGSRQLLAVLVAVAALLTPVLSGLTWVVRGADGPLQRDATSLLPAFAQAELEASPGLRVLVMAPAPDGRLTYELTGPEGARADTALLAVPRDQRRALDAVVADLASPSGSDAAEALSTRAVRYVGVRLAPASQGLVDVLDGQRGLVRRTTGPLALWQVTAPSSRLSVLPPALAVRALAGDRAPSPALLETTRPTALPAGPRSASTQVRPGQTGRLLVLASAQHERWVATLDGKSLRARTAWGWAQAFELPPEGGRLEVDVAHRGRTTSLALQALLIVLVAVLSAPGGRRRRGLEREADDGDERGPSRERVPLAAL